MFNASVIKPLAFALLATAAVPAHADWYLDNESSRLSFVTTKNTEIAEVHRFLVLHGKVDSKGAAQLEVEMESVNSGIPLRDERMRNQLFEIKTFPEALINTQINLQPINDLAPGAQLELRLPLSVTLHGKTQTYSAELLATRLDDDEFSTPAWFRAAPLTTRRTLVKLADDTRGALREFRQECKSGRRGASE